MIKFLNFDIIDPVKWDEVISQSQFPTVFATFQFLSIGCPTGALIVDDYETVIPLPYKSKFWVRYIYSPPFVSRLGVFSKSTLDASEIARLLKEIPTSFVLTELLLNQSNSMNDAQLFPSYQLSLDRPFETIYPLFSENTKRNIKSSLKNDLNYSSHVTIEETIALFQENRGKDLENPIPDSHYNVLLKLAKHAEKAQILDKIAVHNSEGILLAAALFLQDHQRVWFWFSGRNNTYSDQKGMFYLLQEYIKLHSDQNLIFDFNGSKNPNIARFYRGFGAEEYSYPFYTNYNPILNPFIKGYKFIFK